MPTRSPSGCASPLPKAVVTGSAGFLGERFCTALLERGYEVDGIDTRPSLRTTVVGDLTVDGPWQPSTAAADLVVHTAAIVGEKGSWDRFRAVNVGGTRRVLAATTGRLLHLSSIVVHGPDFPDQVGEDSPVQPTGNPYTDTKIASEHLVLQAAAAGAAVTVVRPGDVYGPGSVPWTIRPVEMLKKRQLAAFNGGVLSPVYVDDVVSGALAAATSDAGLGQVFHLSGGVGVSPTEFFGHYARMTGRRLPVLPLPLVRGLAGPLSLLGDRAPLSRKTLEYVTHPGTYSIAKAEALLGWTPQVDLAEGMARTELWLNAEGLL
jgi:nucleoside-diphosphate-sugar epimerase